MRYVTLLRGINVGGKKLIKMDALRRVFELAGYQNVRTLIASGNVMFDAPETEPAALAKKIEKQLLKAFGHEVPVGVWTSDELKALVKRNPFRKVDASKDVMLSVTFLLSTPSLKLKPPFVSAKDGLEVLAIHGGAVFVVSRRKSNGMFAFPHEFIEKTFGVRSTTRNWTTVQRLAAAQVEAKE